MTRGKSDDANEENAACTLTQEAPMDKRMHDEQPRLDPLLAERLLDLGALVTLLQEQLTQVHTTCEAVLTAVERCTAHQAAQTAVWHQLQARLDALQASVQTLLQPPQPAARSGWPRWLPGGRRLRERET